MQIKLIFKCNCQFLLSPHVWTFYLFLYVQLWYDATYKRKLEYNLSILPNCKQNRFTEKKNKNIKIPILPLMWKIKTERRWPFFSWFGSLAYQKMGQNTQCKTKNGNTRLRAFDYFALGVVNKKWDKNTQCNI